MVNSHARNCNVIRWKIGWNKTACTLKQLVYTEEWYEKYFSLCSQTHSQKAHKIVGYICNFYEN